MTDREEPVWTGRYGEAHTQVMADGRDYQVIAFDSDADSSKNGTRIFGPGEHVHPDTLGNWTDNIVIRAYNAEDAFRNAYGALGQWNCWFNEYPGLDWQTAPFTDENGNFPEDGGNHDMGFDAFPPDDTAKDGITRPDIFSESNSFVARSVTLDRETAPSPGI